MNNSGSKKFIETLRKIIKIIISEQKEVSICQNIISILQNRIFSINKDSYTLENSIKILNQARVLIGFESSRDNYSGQLKTMRQASILREIETKLGTTFNIPKLMDILYTGLPPLGIKSCYLSLYDEEIIYDQTRNYSTSSKLILAYCDRKRYKLPEEGVLIESKNLVPKKFLPKNRRYSYIIEPLYFREKQHGYVLFEMGPRDGAVYEALGTVISSALQGALLVRRLHERSSKIFEQKYILDTFMESIPDRIWFKDLDGKFTKANKAHAKVLGLNDPKDEIGKTDSDFYGPFGKDFEAEEKKIIKTGKPILHKELSGKWPDGSQRWSLVTKMPLRNDNNEIIGTFGIARDITELKISQMNLEKQTVELAKANKEIQILNKQLKNENLEMHTEMELARRIQTALLPKNIKNIHPDFSIAAKMVN